MKRKYIISATFVLLAIGFLIGGYVIFGSFAASRSVNASKETQPEQKQQFVVALGRLEPANKVIKLTAPQSNGGGNPRLAKLFVSEGDEIHIGQIIGELDGKEKQIAVVNEAAKKIAIAERQLAQIKAGAKIGDIEAQRAGVERLQTERQKAEVDLKRASNAKDVVPATEIVTIQRLEAELQNAAIELNRGEKLSATGDMAKTELDKRRLNFEVAGKSLAEAKANLKTLTENRRLTVETLNKDIDRSQSSLDSISEVRAVDVNTAQAEIDNAKAALRTSQAVLDDLSVKALADGQVLKIHTRPGETISTDGIVEIGETSQMFVVAEVFEEDISKIKLDQNAEMTIRSTNEKLGGTVAEIGRKIGKGSLLDTDPVADVDARVVEVRVKLTEQDSRKVANLTNLRVDVRIGLS